MTIKSGTKLLIKDITYLIVTQTRAKQLQKIGVEVYNIKREGEKDIYGVIITQ